MPIKLEELTEMEKRFDSIKKEVKGSISKQMQINEAYDSLAIYDIIYNTIEPLKPGEINPVRPVENLELANQILSELKKEKFIVEIPVLGKLYYIYGDGK